MADDPDFRFYASFRDSPKRLALEEALGPKGLVALVDLWCWARSNRATGDLSGLSVASVETAARWHGRRGALVAVLAAQGWLDGPEGAWRLHGWGERQGWAKASPARSQAGKVAAIVKQARRHGVTPDQWIDDVGGEDATNEALRERARQAYAKPNGRTTNRSKSLNDQQRTVATYGNESLSLVSTPSPSPTPTPSPTGGGEGGRGSAADVPRNASSASPPGSDADPPPPIPCAVCARDNPTERPYRASYGPGTPQPSGGLTEPLCHEHFTANVLRRARTGA